MPASVNVTSGNRWAKRYPGIVPAVKIGGCRDFVVRHVAWDDPLTFFQRHAHAMTVASAMMMGGGLVAIRRHLVAIAVEMPLDARSHLGTTDRFRRLRGAACPEDKHQHQGAEKGKDAAHW